jgi:hypothetical protein
LVKMARSRLGRNLNRVFSAWRPLKGKELDKREWLSIDELHVIRAFLEAGVRFLIAGGRAVQFHGHSRPTKDLDLLVETSPEGGKRLAAALKSLGTDVNPAQFGNLSEDRPARGVVCRYPVEFITTIKGVRFLDAWADGVQTASADGLAFRILSKPHLILSKTNTGRPLDVEDVQALQTSSLNSPAPRAVRLLVQHVLCIRFGNVHRFRMRLAPVAAVKNAFNKCTIVFGQA